MAKEAQPSIPKELSPSNIVTRVLSQLEPQKEVVESESGGKGESNIIHAMLPEENREEDQPMNKADEKQTVQIVKKEVQQISSPPKDRAKSPTLEPSFQTPPGTKSMLESSSRHYD